MESSIEGTGGFALLTAGCLQVPAYAAGNDGQLIRVALFANLGSTYKSTTPIITLESAGEWSLQSGGSANASLPSGQARFSADGFRVKVLETADFKTAAADRKILCRLQLINLCCTPHRLMARRFISCIQVITGQPHLPHKL